MSAERESCQFCRFWDRYAESALSRIVGDCRRRPPVISEALLQRSLPGPGTGLDEMELELTLYLPSAFPVTHETSWCGEFEAGGDA